MASAEFQKRKREEYEMQLFGFHSRAVYATLKDIIEKKIQTRCRSLSEAIDKKYSLDEEGKAILKSNIKELKKAYIQGAQPHLKNIQGIVNKYVAIPNNVLLKEDKCQAVQYSEDEFKEHNKKLEDLQSRLKRAKVLNVALNKELEATNEIQEFEDSANKIFTVIEKALRYPKLGRETAHVVEKYETLNNILEIITPKTEKKIFNPNFKHIQLEDCNLDSEY